MGKLQFIEKANVELLYGRGVVERKIFEYEDKAIFKHMGSWHFCKKVDGKWKKYEIKVDQYRILKPKV
ncbi:hypothetical protein [Paenibacillus sp. NAIST15-1]|uniref:hypothetical protein n=1 Tax=Paenibacillus sp. NAIST15-1 TaxID=1605994 RepID=UPI00086E229A|nr:hypothetical protein [Paenibacillus sp. NAIST15-1]GAV11316.1 kelch repeat-containing protein [Paenibacillus sp. NAIST15-1]